MSKQEISQKSGMSLDQAVGYIENVIDGIRRGVLTIEAGDKSVTIHPSRNVDFEIEAARKKDKESVTIELTWRLEEKTKHRDEAPPLRITAQEPPPEPEAVEEEEADDEPEHKPKHKVG